MNERPEAKVPPSASAGRDPSVRTSATYLILQLLLPSEISVHLPLLGEVVLRPRLHAPSSAGTCLDGGQPMGEAFLLASADQVGRLLIESRLAANLVNGILGLPVPPFGGRLTRIERGVLVGVLAALLAERNLAPSVGIREAEGAVADSESFVLGFSIRLRGGSGQAWLVASGEFLATVWAILAEGGEPRTPWLELAATTIEDSEMIGAAPGDLVVFSETAALPELREWPVKVHNGTNSVSGRWLADGLVVAGEKSVASEAATCSGRGAIPPASSATRLAVVATVPCRNAGSTTFGPLFATRGDPVVLKAGDRLLAYGEVTECDGAFAVLITQRPAD